MIVIITNRMKIITKERERRGVIRISRECSLTTCSDPSRRSSGELDPSYDLEDLIFVLWAKVPVW